MEFIKSVLVKLGSGVLYGAGFIVGLGIIGVYVLPHFQDAMISGSEENIKSIFIEYDESANLLTKVTNERISDEDFTLLGAIENKGDKTWSSISLKAELYDSNGNFIEQCEEYVNQTSRPGSSINFKLSCGSQCSKLQMEQYSSYKLLISDARHKL